MTREEIRTLRDKIGTDPILTDEEIEYIWIAMDKQASMKPNERSCELDREYGYCPSCEVWFVTTPHLKSAGVADRNWTGR